MTKQKTIEEIQAGWKDFDRPNAGDRYRHYKGGEYEIVATGFLEDTEAPCVVYRSLKKDIVWVRTAKNFLETVEHDGKSCHASLSFKFAGTKGAARGGFGYLAQAVRTFLFTRIGWCFTAVSVFGQLVYGVDNKEENHGSDNQERNNRIDEVAIHELTAVYGEIQV